MGETKSMFVGVAIGILLTMIITALFHNYVVYDLNEQLENMTNNTQLAYDIGFNQGIIYTANYTTQTRNFTYIENDELKMYSITEATSFQTLTGHKININNKHNT